MGMLYPQRLHQRRDIIGKELGRVGPLGLVTFTRASQVHRDTGEVLGVLGDLKSVTGVISRQIRDKDERLSCSLLVIVDVISFARTFGMLPSPFLTISLESVLTLARNEGHTP